MVGVIVMKNIDFDGDHIMWMVVVSTVAAAILWLALIIKSYYKPLEIAQ